MPDNSHTHIGYLSVREWNIVPHAGTMQDGGYTMSEYLVLGHMDLLSPSQGPILLVNDFNK